MHYNGMVQFLERIGFLEVSSLWAEEHGYDSSHRVQHPARGLNRTAHTQAWLGEPLRCPSGHFLDRVEYANMTGYDLMDFVRSWLRREGHDRLSVCEVVLLDNRFADLRHYVDKANIFWSHPQMQDFITHTTRTMKGVDYYDADRWSGGVPALPHPDLRVMWLDYFSLRHCHPDFEARKINELVGDIGLTVAELDMRGEYFKSSICLFELYATVRAGCKLICPIGRECFSADQMNCWPLKVEDATTRAIEDKEQIDQWIQGMDGGFARLNQDVTDSVFRSCALLSQRVS